MRLPVTQTIYTISDKKTNLITVSTRSCSFRSPPHRDKRYEGREIGILKKDELMVDEDIVQKLQMLASAKGATSTKVIPASEVIVGDWVRQKCEFGCRGYARYFTCRPYTPSPEETRKRLQEYSHALLVEFTELKEKEEQLDVHKLMFQLEREAFLSGLYKAFAYVSGPCRLCDICQAGELRHGQLESKKGCKNPKMARPSMEGCGIDVFATGRKAGYEIDVVKEKDECYKCFGLLLLE